MYSHTLSYLNPRGQIFDPYLAKLLQKVIHLLKSKVMEPVDSHSDSCFCTTFFFFLNSALLLSLTLH